MSAIHGCITCITEFPRETATGTLCPMCHGGVVDDYHMTYWADKLIAQSEAPMKPKSEVKVLTKDERQRNAFKADILRVCQIHKLTLYPRYFKHGAWEDTYLIVSPVSTDKDLEPIREAI